MREPPSLLRTSATVVWTFVVASVVWIRFSSFYNQGIAGLGNLFLPQDLSLRAFSQAIRIEHTTGADTYTESIDSLVLHSGLLIVIALVASTPWRSFTWRLVAVLAVAVGFFVVQSIGISVFAAMLKRSLGGDVSIGEVNIGFAIFWALTPLLAGGIWAYRYWLPIFRIQPSSTEDVETT